MVDYWNSDIACNPQCPHGPTLLFSRKGNDRKFYVCSAFRDRKKCSFFRWIDSVPEKEAIEDNQFEKLISTFSARRKEVQKFQDSKTSYCCTCEMLISSQDKNYHIDHELNEDLRKEDLRFPTLVMKPKQQSKGESQYHFSVNTLNLLDSFLSQLKASAVVCIGCPHLHEFLLNTSGSFRSLLLDIDPRYLQFYDPDQFQLFNMFNCHMFDSHGWGCMEEIAAYDRIMIIVDPPFGGRIEPLAYTINRITSFLKTKNRSAKAPKITVLLVLPYFMESVVKQSLPDFCMLDYKVEYRNHRQFKKRENSVNDRGSAVRLFTNANPSLFTFPEKEGYKYCDMCERWVYNENKHCFKCEACTSKNGGLYKHCNTCGKCVKQTWKHCKKCGICKLVGHTCNEGSSDSPRQVTESNNRPTKRKRWNKTQKNDKKPKRKSN